MPNIEKTITTKPNRILIIMPKFKPPSKESSLFATFYEEIQILAQKLGKLTIITTTKEKSKNKTTKNLCIYQIKDKKTPKIKGLYRIIAFATKIYTLRNNFDCLFIRNFSSLELTMLIFTKLLKKKCVFLIPGTWIYEPATPKNLFLRLLFRIATSLSDLIILYSWLMLEPIKKYAPTLNSNKVRIVPNGVNIKRFKPIKREKLKFFKKKLGLPQNGYVVLYVGRVSHSKGLEDLILAAGIVCKKLPKVHFIIVGNHYHVDFINQLKLIARKNNVYNKIIFMGPVSNNFIPILDNIADIFVMPSKGGEGITRAMLEAMSCGTPVITTNVGGNPDAVINGETGFIINVGDYETLANKILTLLKDSELRRKIGINARKRIINRFSLEKNMSHLAQILARV